MSVSVQISVRRCRAVSQTLFALYLCALPAMPARMQGQTAPKLPSVSGDTLEAMSELNFEVIGTKRGLPNDAVLPHNSVFSFAQDTTGFLWVATFGGLARYSGYHVRSYTHNPDVPGSLPDNNVRTLLAKQDGGLWVGTGSAGMVIYDPAKDDFEVPENTPDTLRESRVFCMAPDGEGGVWFGTQYGLAHYVVRNKTFELYGMISPTPDRSGFPAGSIFSVLVDSQHNLWVGGDAGLFLRKAGSTQFVAVPGIAGLEELGEKPPIWAIFEDHTGKIWIGSDTTGIGIVDLASNRIRGVPKLAGAGSVSSMYTVRGFIEASAGVLWVATYGGGLLQIDTNRNSIHQWTKDTISSQPLSSDFLRCVFLDRSGEMWLGTDAGLAKFYAGLRGIFTLHTSALRPNLIARSAVRSVTAGYGRVAVGFDHGEFSVLEGDGSIHPVLPAAGMRAQDKSHREVLAIKTLDDHTFIAGGAGLYTIDAPSFTYHAVQNDTLRKATINTLWVDGDIVWTGSHTGLMRYNRRTGEVKVFGHDVANPTSVADNYVRDILKSKDGRLWITTRLGLDLFDASTWKFQHFRHHDKDAQSLASDNVQQLAEDDEGHLWIGTIGAGLSVLEDWPTGGQPRFHTIDHTNGLLDDIVLTITKGNDGRMWVNTPSGLAAITPHTFAMETYTQSEGLQMTEQNLFSSTVLEDGSVLFPGSSSLVLVRPTHLKPWRYQAPLVLTSMTIPNVGTDSVVLARSAMAGKLKFASREGFHADFALLDFTYPANTVYSYRLQGFDSDWSEPSRTQLNATYTKLPHGTYHFQVRATSRDGSGPTSVLDIPVQVTTRFYETDWFRAVAVLMVIAAVMVFIRIRIAYMTRRQGVLEYEIAQRTAELKENQRELMLANERLADLALHDTLTGILNRRGFFERADLEVMRSRRNGRTFSLLLADLDNFKTINDTRGHIAGDHCLKSVAKVLTKNLRPTDLIARYGGEELIMLLPETTEELALNLAERLRQAVADLHLTYNGHPITITISIGVTSSQDKKDLDTLVAEVDRALYVAKNAGKNRVSILGQEASSA